MDGANISEYDIGFRPELCHQPDIAGQAWASANVEPGSLEVRAKIALYF